MLEFFKKPMSRKTFIKTVSVGAISALLLSKISFAKTIFHSDHFNASKIVATNSAGELITTTEDVTTLTNAKNGSICFGLKNTIGNNLSTGVKRYVVIPFNCTITRWDIVGDQNGNVVVDVWKANNAIPTVADTITGTEKPTLSSQQLNSDTALSSWTTSISTGDVLGFNIDSVSALSGFTLTIKVEKI